MVTGWDHLLFIAGVLLLAGNARTAAKFISLFVAGHSLTLLAATIAGWKVNATAVDVVIALSVVYVGVVGTRESRPSARVFGTAVFGFGLVHGLGLSTRLQDLGLPDDGLVTRVVLFNIGVELGQLTALAVLFGIGRAFARALRSEANRKPIFGGLVAAGLIAAAVISFPSTEPETRTVKADDGSTTACTETDEAAPISLAGDHPAKRFYGPTEPAPEDDLAHIIGDGLVVVRYHPDAAKSDLRGLRDLTADPNQFTVAAADPTQDEPLRAVTARRTLSCERVDLTGVADFRERWIDELGAQRE